MDIEELIKVWRKKKRGYTERVRKGVLKNIDLPEQTKRFLNQGGIAELLDYGVETPTLPRLTELGSYTEPWPTSFARYRVLMKMGWSFLCLDEEGSGQVIMVTDQPESKAGRTVAFASSSYEKYAECSLVYSRMWEAIEQAVEQGKAHVSSEKRNEYIEACEQAICEIDPAALADERNWFAILLADEREFSRELQRYKHDRIWT